MLTTNMTAHMPCAIGTNQCSTTEHSHVGNLHQNKDGIDKWVCIQDWTLMTNYDPQLDSTHEWCNEDGIAAYIHPFGNSIGTPNKFEQVIDPGTYIPIKFDMEENISYSKPSKRGYQDSKSAVAVQARPKSCLCKEYEFPLLGNCYRYNKSTKDASQNNGVSRIFIWSAK